MLFFQDTEAPIVSIADGKIAGTLLQSAKNETFFAYFQIPYASPPVGSLRFEVRCRTV